MEDPSPQSLHWEVHPISPVTKEWIAVESPTILLTSLYFYFAIVGLGFVILKNVPKDPNQKDPLWLKSLVIFHNVFLVSLSLYMCGGCLLEVGSAHGRAWVWGRGSGEEAPRKKTWPLEMGEGSFRVQLLTDEHPRTRRTSFGQSWLPRERPCVLEEMMATGSLTGRTEPFPFQRLHRRSTLELKGEDVTTRGFHKKNL